jgi:hypothetical protein
VPVAGEQADSHGIAPCHEAIAVVLDLVDPVRPGGRSIGGGRQAGLDEAPMGGGSDTRNMGFV